MSFLSVSLGRPGGPAVKTKYTAVWPEGSQLEACTLLLSLPLHPVSILNCLLSIKGRKQIIIASLLLSMCICVLIQVIAGAGMDVDFTIVSPEGVRLIEESRRSDGVHVLVLSSLILYFISVTHPLSHLSINLIFTLLQGGAYRGWRLSSLLWQQLQSLLREDGVLWDPGRGSRRRCGWRWWVDGFRGSWWNPAGVQAGRHHGEMQQTWDVLLYS